MKTKLTVIILVLCSCSILNADLDIREIGPVKAGQLGWKVDVHERKEYVQFTVQLPADLLSQGRTAHLSVWHERKLATSCILGLHKRRQGSRYEFAVAKQYLVGSTFELGLAPTVVAGESYRMRLNKFTNQEKKKPGPLCTVEKRSSFFEAIKRAPNTADATLIRDSGLATKQTVENKDARAVEKAVRVLIRQYKTRIDGTRPPDSWPTKIRKVGDSWVVDIDTTKLPGGYPEQIVVDVFGTGGHSRRPKR